MYSLTKSLFDSIYQIKYRSGQFINIKKLSHFLKVIDDRSIQRYVVDIAIGITFRQE